MKKLLVPLLLACAFSPALFAQKNQSAQTLSGAPTVTARRLNMRTGEVGLAAPTRAIDFVNTSSSIVIVSDVIIIGRDASAFRIDRVTPPTASWGPSAFGPGQTVTGRVTFTPEHLGMHRAQIFVLARDIGALRPIRVSLRGVGLGPMGADLRVNAGGPSTTTQPAGGGASLEWAASFGARQSRAVSATGTVQGTTDPELYLDQQSGAKMRYVLPLARPGLYRVVLHFADMQSLLPGERIMDVSAAGQLVLDDLDIVGLVGPASAHQETFLVDAPRPFLDLVFRGVVGKATVAAIEIYGVPNLIAEPAAIDFGAVESGSSEELALLLRNTGAADLTIDTVSFNLAGSGDSAAFSLVLGGTTYNGQGGNVTFGASRLLVAGGQLRADVSFAPLREQYDRVDLVLTHAGGSLSVPLIGLGGHSGDPFLHVVLAVPPFIVDYDGDGSEGVFLDGSGSHTHEPGRGVVDWLWSVNDMLVATGSPVVQRTLSVSTHQIELEIVDDNFPARRLTSLAITEVVPTNRIPGVLARYYPAPAAGAAAMLDGSLGSPEFSEVLTGLQVTGPATIGGSLLTTNAVVQLTARFGVPVAGSYVLQVVGGVEQRIDLDGTPYTGVRSLSPGLHDLDVRFAVDDLSDLPLSVSFAIDGAPATPLPAAQLVHEEGGLVPVINSLTAIGSTLGGNQITIDGQGFFPGVDVEVQWGGTLFTPANFTSIRADQIVLVSPAAPAGFIQVSVSNQVGTSNAKTFEYADGGPVPLRWRHDHDFTVQQPTAATWGPDGRMYVVSLGGRLTALEFDDDWNEISKTIYTGITGLSNRDSLGIAIDPYDEYDSADPTKPVRVYIAHGEHFANGGSSFTGPSAYTGQISRLDGPSFNVPVPVITGLPAANHDHAVNGIEFDNNGDLLIAAGGNTNAGVIFPTMGDLPESPLSAAVLLARLSEPGFTGDVRYAQLSDGVANDDQVFGDRVELLPGSGVEVYASGLRNSLDLALSAQGVLYATDNGPNFGFGPASTGPTAQASDPEDGDEVLLVEPGRYFGHPNRTRGLSDPRQNIYYPTSTGGSVPGVFTQAMQATPSASCGIDEYRSDVFKGRMRGDLIIQKWFGFVQRLELSADGRTALSFTNLNTWAVALGMLTGPGGTLWGIDYNGGRLRLHEPNDSSATGLEVHDITPWRAPATGGARFVVAGVGFGTLGNTTVSIGGKPATLTRVSATRIEGVVPAEAQPSVDLLDVVVTVGAASDSHAEAFRYLIGRGLEPGRWRDDGQMPTALGEASSAVVGGILYIVGEGSSATLRYDLMQRTWLSNGATRPYTGHHHVAEVVGGKLYLLGGLGGGSEGRVQIYDPGTDSWSLGTDMTWAGGALSSAVIGGEIYAAGGIVSTYTVNNFARYDPQADTWTGLPIMPSGRNHAASATDGSSLYIFGGRRGGNFIANGYAETMKFDTALGSWSISSDPGATIAPLPVGRGGMGRAVWFRGEFYVFGGETLDDPAALPGTNVYDRVDVYDPLAGTWRLEAPMPIPRHGLAPVLFDSRIYLPGGGLTAGFSQSRAFDDYQRH